MFATERKVTMTKTRLASRITNTVILFAACGAFSAFGQTFAASGTTTLSVNVAAEASLSIGTATTSLTSATGLFADYTGTTNFTYKIRTTQTGGTGAVNVQITGDFSGSGGPSVASPPSAGDALTYSCTVASPATACTGPVTALTTGTTSVATFGADARSAKAGNSGSLAWTLTNDPVYKTGSYTATATFTISAT
jgi:hypothetical protein